MWAVSRTLGLVGGGEYGAGASMSAIIGVRIGWADNGPDSSFILQAFSLERYPR